jgi:phosphate starvation-inducible PhoH-like protein
MYDKETARPTSNFFKKFKQTDLYPKSINQLSYYDALNNIQNQMIIGIGPAGCGKTLFACFTALQELRSKTVSKIIITRPLISVEQEDIGFLPGTMTDEMDPWNKPKVEVLSELLTKESVDQMIAHNIIELCPLAYMRGRTFKNAGIIADEMQNSSPNQMLMLATRLGEKSRMVVTGDLKQSDRMESNGLLDLIHRHHTNQVTFAFKCVYFLHQIQQTIALHTITLFQITCNHHPGFFAQTRGQHEHLIG